jgi:hypothetical protein
MVKMQAIMYAGARCSIDTSGEREKGEGRRESVYV